MNEQQIIEAALKDAGIPAAQAAAYRLLLQHADRFSAMENLKNEEASGGRTAATPSPDQVSGAKSNEGEAPCSTGNANFSGPAPESGLDPRVEQISRGHDGVWRAYGHDVNGKWWDLVSKSANLADLVGTSYPVLTQRMAALAADNSKLRAKVEALAALNVRLTDESHEARRTRDAAQAECNRLLGEKRRLEDELANYRADAVSQFRKPTPTPEAMVRQFNRKFNVPIADVPAFPTRERMNLRVRLIAEEFCEFLAACGHCFIVDIGEIFYQRATFPKLNLIAAADGLADMQFVIEGAALEFGIPLAAVFSEVHRSNMTKTGQPDAGGKITKGDGYEPPKIEDILREHGREG